MSRDAEPVALSHCQGGGLPSASIEPKLARYAAFCSTPSSSVICRHRGGVAERCCGFFPSAALADRGVERPPGLAPAGNSQRRVLPPFQGRRHAARHTSLRHRLIIGRSTQAFACSRCLGERAWSPGWPPRTCTLHFSSVSQSRSCQAVSGHWLAVLTIPNRPAAPSNGTRPSSPLGLVSRHIRAARAHHAGRSRASRRPATRRPPSAR